MGRLKTAKMVKLICCICKKEFERSEPMLKYNLGMHYFCGTECFKKWLPEMNRRKKDGCLTHKQLIEKTTKFFNKNSWEKIPLRGVKIITGFNPVFYPDAFYFHNKNGKYVIAAEVKPEYNNRREIFVGIGQCLGIMLFHNIKPYLIIHEKNLNMLKPFYDEYLGWLGIISFDDIGNMSLRKKSLTNNLGEQLK